ncbi:MAG TPA: ribulose-phosphate 3-epimerase [Candidatus Nitrosocosmicus sp.]|nr:ribulose-phosphate 3-epimerase [Candidatus Nitrosocosmicus sp.]
MKTIIQRCLRWSGGHDKKQEFDDDMYNVNRYLKIKEKLKELRIIALTGIAEAGSGHPGASFSSAEIMGCLYFQVMNNDIQHPSNPNRDYFINSKAHSAPGYYATLSLFGSFPRDEIKTLRKLNSRLQGHPVRYSERQKHHSVPGIEYSGGSEGIGLSVSIGICLANKLDKRDNMVYCLLGDGETNEGQIWEASMAAAKFKLNNLIAILDRNKIQQDGFTEEVMPIDPVKEKWLSFNWEVVEVNGHKIEQLIPELLKRPVNKPKIIIANTVKGNGIKHMANNPQWHGKAPSKKHLPLLIRELEGEYMISPSIIAGSDGIDEESLKRKIATAERFGADMIHLDVMDGKFVPNSTFFFDTIKKLRGSTRLPFDAHLMIQKPESVLDNYIDAGCDVITVHAEACSNEQEFERINSKLVSSGISPGLAVNPGTELPEWIFSYFDNLDLIIIMSVNPGFAGQKFIPEVLPKMKKVIPLLRERGFKGYIEADGGIDLSTITQCFEAGCRIFVMGNAIFGHSDVEKRIRDTKFLLDSYLEKSLLGESKSLNLQEDWIKGRRNIIEQFNLSR